MTQIVRLREALADHYAVESELGRGGMASVFLATDLKLNRKVAIKVLHADLAAAVGAERFKREIQIVTALSHPNILAIYDSGEADGLLYYVMPLVEGQSLRDLLDRQRQLPLDDAVRLAVQVANALDYAHRHGIVHRDIKPENILLEDGQAIVADFGVARAVTAAADGAKLTQTGMAIGTPTYMSPEQALADPNLDGRSDQYALGCVVYEMIAGQPPFTGSTMQQLVMAHAMAPVPSLRIARQTVSEELESVILRALAKSPADRWPSPKEFAQALVAPTNVTWSWKTPGTAMFEVQKQAKRQRLVRIGAAAAAIIILALGGGLAFWKTGRASSAVPVTDGLEPRRVAVTYFGDASTQGELAYLADGLTESLIDRLGQVDGLDVVSRSGVERFRNEGTPADSVARALEAGTLVRGTVEDAGDNVKVSVQLVDGASGDAVERRSFVAPKAGALGMRDSLAVEVAAFLRARLGREVRLRQQRASTSSDAAWVLVRRAEQARREAEALVDDDDHAGADRRFVEADGMLQQASASDPQWTEPQVQRAWVAYRRARIAETPREQVSRAREAIAIADQVLARQPTDAGALEIRGTSRYFLYLAHLIPDQREADQAFADAERDLVASTERDPDNASAWTSLSHLYAAKPDFAQAKLAALNAYRKDAYLTRASDILGRLYQTSYLTETFNDADHWCEEGSKRFPKDPRFTSCRLWLLTVPKVTTQPLPDSAWKLVSVLDAMLPKTEAGAAERQQARIVAAIVLGRAKMADSAGRVLDRVHAARGDDDLLFLEAYARLTMGDRDAALALLRDYVARNPEHREGWRKDSAWWWRDLEQDPRFQQLMGS